MEGDQEQWQQPVLLLLGASGSSPQLKQRFWFNDLCLLEKALSTHAEYLHLDNTLVSLKLAYKITNFQKSLPVIFSWGNLAYN